MKALFSFLAIEKHEINLQVSKRERMKQYRIKIVNTIAKEGLDLLDSRYACSPDTTEPDGIIVRSSPVDTSLYSNLSAVARAGAGVNNISVEKATQQGVCVFNTPGANANAVAELVFVMLGICARNIHLGSEFCRTLGGLEDEKMNQLVEQQKGKFKGFELAGKTLGVIGLGKIGVRIANGGTSRQMKVIGFDPYPAMENIHALSPDVVLARSIKEVLHHADILTVHVPLVDKTRRFINQKIIEQLKPGGILMNYARGPVVDTEAVLNGLKNGRLQNYITDFPSPGLLAHPQVICTPHLGASTEESEEQCACMAVKELKDYLEYGTISHSVNFPTTESIPSDNVHTRLIMINRDIPGMIGFASQVIGSHGINIASYINESNGTIGYNIIDLESEISGEVLAEIEANADVIRTRIIRF